MSKEDNPPVIEEFVKNRAKFEWALLSVIVAFVSNYFITGKELPPSMMDLFTICVIAYVFIFSLDVTLPVLKAVLEVWSAKKPPSWVEPVLLIAENQMKLLESLPLAICPLRKVAQHGYRSHNLK
jgi:hypothetical protein